MAIAGLAGNEMAQPRVFAHDAVAITGSSTQIAGTENRGCCLYIGCLLYTSPSPRDRG